MSDTGKQWQDQQARQQEERSVGSANVPISFGRGKGRPEGRHLEHWERARAHVEEEDGTGPMARPGKLAWPRTFMKLGGPTSIGPPCALTSEAARSRWRVDPVPFVGLRHRFRGLGSDKIPQVPAKSAAEPSRSCGVFR
jgi:hypothetical protein